MQTDRSCLHMVYTVMFNMDKVVYYQNISFKLNKNLKLFL